MINRVSVDVISNLPARVLEKDLQDGQSICPTCHGLGVVLDDNQFGIVEDNSTRVMFPYVKQSFHYCPTCYNGVVTPCKYCGKINKMYIDPSAHCDCDESRRIRARKAYQDRLKRYDDAKFVPLDDAEKYGMVYLADHDEYVEVDDLEGWIEDRSDDEDFEIGHVYATTTLELQLDAQDIVESACDEMHEDAMDSIGVVAIKELQELLDKWLVENTRGVKTYYPDFKIAIELPDSW